MKPILIPRRQNHLETKGALPFGMAHPNDTPCPFANDNLPFGTINTCCCFNMEKVMLDLVLVGGGPLDQLLKRELACETLPTVAEELRDFAALLEGRYIEHVGMPDGSQLGGVFDLVAEKFIPWSPSAFAESLASIRKAADWYEKVGRLGCDVEVWY